jgi:hypothetical protein
MKHVDVGTKKQTFRISYVRMCIVQINIEKVPFSLCGGEHQTKQEL